MCEGIGEKKTREKKISEGKCQLLSLDLLTNFLASMEFYARTSFRMGKSSHLSSAFSIILRLYRRTRFGIILHFFLFILCDRYSCAHCCLSNALKLSLISFLAAAACYFGNLSVNHPQCTSERSTHATASDIILKHFFFPFLK